MVKRLFRLEILLISLFLLSGAPCQAVTLNEAMEKAAEFFTKKAVNIEQGQTLYLVRVVNINTFQEDETGQKILNELAIALENASPEYTLTMESGNAPESDINLTGVYDLKGENVTVKFRVFKGKEILAQYEASYEVEKVRRKTLVAVLDIEAKTLDRSRRKAFSDIFRSALSDIDDFDLASSADIDKMNPDMIQEATGCTRDSCATIIGEQLGVDRVISTSMYEVAEGLHIISSKVMDIEEGATIISRTVEHQGDLKSISTSLKKLAVQITGKTQELETSEEEPDKGHRTLRYATDQAAFYFTKTAVKIEAGQELHIMEITNANSKKRDDYGKRIESELFFSLERQL